MFDSKTEDWCYELSIFFDPFADEPPAVPYFYVHRNYPGRGVVSNPVCKLIDSWLDKIVSGQLNNEDIAYDNSDGLWCSVAHMQELVLGNPIGAEVCLLRFHFSYSGRHADVISSYPIRINCC